MPKQLKKYISEDIEKRLKDLSGYVLVDFKGLDSAHSFDLRKSLHTSGVAMTVVPNRLAARVLDRWQGQKSQFRGFFRGPTAVVYGSDGAVAAAKAVFQWKKKNKDLLGIKGGVLGEDVLSRSKVETLSKIPGRQQILAQVAGMMQSPLTRLACAASGVLRNLVCVIDAARKKLEDGGAAGGSPVEGSGDPAAAGSSSVNG